jgi:hypothetical protein
MRFSSIWGIRIFGVGGDGLIHALDDFGEDVGIKDRFV